MSAFPLARLLDFIRRVAPFDTLAEEELRRVVSRMEVAYYPQGQVIIQAGGESARFLYLIFSGSVRVALPEDRGEDILIDVRGEGDTFGAVSLLQSRKALFSVTAQEDLLAFLMPGEEFQRLVDEHQEFERHFSHSLVRNIQAARQAADGRLSQMTGTESLTQMALQMRGRVADLMSTNVVVCAPDQSIRHVAQVMTRRRVGSIIVEASPGQAVGVLTDTDLRARVLATDLSPEAPVHEIMSRPPLTISSQAFAFEAMLEMTRHGVHHLLVTEGGRMVGVISDHDIKVLTGSTPVGLVREIDNIDSSTDLIRMPNRIHRMLEMLLRLDSSAEYMMDLLSELVDRLDLKLFGLAERQMEASDWGGPPTHYCWLALGAAGRREQAPPILQEWALVFSDVAPGRLKSARAWFHEFGTRVADGLEAAGLKPLRPGMGENGSANCRSASEWLDAYRTVVGDRRAMTGPHAPGWFDFRSVHGQNQFAVDLWETIWRAMDQAPDAQAWLAEAAIRRRPPLGFLRAQVVEKDGRCGQRFHLEESGLGLIANAVRPLALAHRIDDTNTLVRLTRLAQMGVIPDRLAADLREAFGFLTILKVSKCLETPEVLCGEVNDIEVCDLNTVQRKMLKESFAVIDQLQELVRTLYQEAPVAAAGNHG